jgi:predicted lysophospholipase L1 biosynthesis ABC-type transport system permease subunit
LPTSGPATGAEIGAATTRIIDELGRVVTLGVVLTMAVAGASLAIAVTGGLLDRRRPFALLRLSGVPLRNLRSVILLEAAAPLIAVAVLSGILGVLVSQLLLRLVSGNRAVPLPDPSLPALLAAGVIGALVIVAGMLPLVGPLTDLEETRFE